MIVGPSQVTGPVCVGCLMALDERKHLDCEKCGWPVCSRECQNNPYHQNECEFTQARGDKVSIKNFITPHPTYECLLPLRCLLLREKNKEKWNKLMQLQSHIEERKKCTQYKSDLEKIGKFIPRFFKSDKFKEDEIMLVNGIVQTNGHELPITNPPCVSIYHQASLLEHSCHPNLSKSFSNKGEVIIWAPHPIQPGEHLSISYTDVLWETSNRRHHLKQTKLFDCFCERCKDVTEYGTYISALKCQKCPEGLLLPKSLDDWEKEWYCNKCENSVPYNYYFKMLEHCGRDLQAMQKENEDNCIRFIEHYSKYLSPNHFYIIDVKIALAQIIGGGEINGIQKVSDERLNLKAQICRDLIDIVMKVAPSESRILGLIKFELHSTYAELGRRAIAAKNPNCRAMLEESLVNCEEVIRYLAYDPEILPEGKIRRQAKINADSLKIMIDGLSDGGL